MKKVFVMAALAMFSFASAQKGTILVAGNIGFSTDKDEVGTSETKTNEFNFTPKVGYQFTDNWTLGLSGNVGMDKTETTTDAGLTRVTSETKDTNFAVGPFVRYSRNISEIFGFFADLDAGYQSVKSTTDPGTPFSVETENKGNGFYAQITPAIFINVKKNFGLNVSFGGLGFDSISYDNNGGDSTNFGFNFGRTVNIGISKNF
ncbi:outer membrane beta-barrel protein [Flavobacterium sp.]|uniref:outer membrane beta-barrel protein n=1 Tax=Flavobacterium sp. TaxID=239 RepID=UPI0039E71232